MNASTLVVRLEDAAKVARDLLAQGVLFDATQDGDVVRFSLKGY